MEESWVPGDVEKGWEVVGRFMRGVRERRKCGVGDVVDVEGMRELDGTMEVG